MVRRSIVSKCFAVWLLVLAVSPLTAPFAAFDFSDQAHPARSDVRRSIYDVALVKFKVAPGSHIAGVPVRNVLPLFVGESPNRLADAVSRTACALTLHCILRL